MTSIRQFTMFSRILHWLMAAMVLAMLFIGAVMAATVSRRYDLLVSIHKPLGVLILVLVAIRLVNRLMNRAPPLPRTLPGWQVFAAKASHAAL
jgi:cytochrome b561